CMAKLTKADLQDQLQRQLGRLRRSSEVFDQGAEDEACGLAVVLRVLLHDRGTSSKSLLGQLGIKDHLRFADTALHVREQNLLSAHGLTVGRIVAADGAITEAAFVAPLGQLDDTRIHVDQPFDRWWTTNVIKDQWGNVFSRKKLTLLTADKDGGAHVDPDLPADYYTLSRGNSMGMTVVSQGEERDFDNAVAYPSIRQIVYEVERTLVKNLPYLAAD
ncbi:MAG: hypothetical protein ACR2PL_05915, partial [Dehalococcoidia bacterium]